MKFPWQRDKELKTALAHERGKLAEAVMRNGVFNDRLQKRRKEAPISGMLDELFAKLDEGRHRD